MSKLLLPSEIQVWYVLPVLRRELALVLVRDNKLAQKEAARLLGITEAAVSQYLSGKRGNDIKLSKDVKAEIKLSAEKLLKGKSNVLEQTMHLLQHKLITNLVCDYHKTNDPLIKKDCKICFHQGVSFK